VIQDGGQFDPFPVQCDLALADAAHVEEIVDEPDHLPDLTPQNVDCRSTRFRLTALPLKDLQGVPEEYAVREPASPRTRPCVGRTP
jgi:hypothetical protein